MKRGFLERSCKTFQLIVKIPRALSKWMWMRSDISQGVFDKLNPLSSQRGARVIKETGVTVGMALQQETKPSHKQINNRKPGN